MIYFYGASGHAKVIIELAELLSLPIGGLVDKNPDLHELLGYTVSINEHEMKEQGQSLYYFYWKQPN